MMAGAAGGAVRAANPLELSNWIASKRGELVSRQVRRSNSEAEWPVSSLHDWLSVSCPARVEILAAVERLLAAA